MFFAKNQPHHEANDLVEKMKFLIACVIMNTPFTFDEILDLVRKLEQLSYSEFVTATKNTQNQKSKQQLQQKQQQQTEDPQTQNQPKQAIAIVKSPYIMIKNKEESQSASPKQLVARFHGVEKVIATSSGNNVNFKEILPLKIKKYVSMASHPLLAKAIESLEENRVVDALVIAYLVSKE